MRKLILSFLLLVVASSFAHADNFMYFKKKAAPAGVGGIAFRNSASSSGLADTTITMAKPTGTADGDLMIAVIGSSSQTPTMTTAAAGWTAYSWSPVDGATDSRLWVYWKIASSEGASWDWVMSAGGQFVWGAASYSGVNGVAPNDNSAGASNASATDHTTPTITTNVTNTMIVAVFCSDQAGAATWSSAMDERFDLQDGQFVALALYDAAQAAAGTVSKTATASTSDIAAVAIIALKP